MPGLDEDIVVHRLPTTEDCPPVKQKVRRMRPGMSKKIKVEVMKQFNAGFLAVTSYPQWVAIVPQNFPSHILHSFWACQSVGMTLDLSLGVPIILIGFVPQNFPSHILQGIAKSSFKIPQGLHSVRAS